MSKIRLLSPKRKKRIINEIILKNDIKKIKTKPRSYPTDIFMSLSNVCNLSCPICSVNNLRKKGVRRVVNNISLKQLKAFSAIFERAHGLNFMGHIGESILNPEFNEIIRYLKSRHHLSLFVSTNGIGLDEKIRNTMLEVGFDSINFSIHASTPETYQILQGGDFNQVVENLTRLANEKERRRAALTHITIVYALNKANIKETYQMIDWAMKLKINKLWLYHYRDYGMRAIVFKDFQSANQLIDDIYSYAQAKKALALLPEKPPYYRKYQLEEEEAEEVKCYLPWRGLQMRASYSHPDSYYLGCCNVFNVFLFNYKSHLDKYDQVSFQQIWHHPVFQYLRETVNSTAKNKRNPLCRYCKSKKRIYLKNTNNIKNYKIKLKVLEEFFRGFSQKYKDVDEIEGLEMLYTEDQELRAMAGLKILVPTIDEVAER